MSNIFIIENMQIAYLQMLMTNIDQSNDVYP